MMVDDDLHRDLEPSRIDAFWRHTSSRDQETTTHPEHPPDGQALEPAWIRAGRRLPGLRKALHNDARSRIRRK